MWKNVLFFQQIKFYDSLQLPDFEIGPIQLMDDEEPPSENCSYYSYVPHQENNIVYISAY